MGFKISVEMLIVTDKKTNEIIFAIPVIDYYWCNTLKINCSPQDVETLSSVSESCIKDEGNYNKFWISADSLVFVAPKLESILVEIKNKDFTI